ncbi:MAG TPA: superoxide dismutase [Caulobacteraceae bacterium]|jgi:Fe-Mn family superoxide dismutase|nr:superoxide dismutase [Caulobacteraceae bacterium]
MFKLPDLPYAYEALEPVISAETMAFHHDKHHAHYVETLNELLKAADESPSDLERVVRKTGHEPQKVKVFDNAAQTWNHTFFWTCMSPEPTQADGELASAIERSFGGLDALKALFVKEGTGHFGSGWVWLAADREALKVLTTHDADDALTHEGMTPLLTCDLWEHAYYLDYQNERQSFLEAWFGILPNWRFAAEQYAAALGHGKAWAHPRPS